MQSLEVISVNLWQIVISLLNLVILFILVKKFLFKPVNKMLEKRQSEIDERYNQADEAKRIAEEDRLLWDEKMSAVKSESEEILKKAHSSAIKKSDAIVSKAKEEAEGLLRQAENEINLEKKKAREEMKKEIVDVSVSLTNKLLEREINEEDHHKLIDSFIGKIGESDE